jgi:hypothetical protein
LIDDFRCMRPACRKIASMQNEVRRDLLQVGPDRIKSPSIAMNVR